jgi:hypothetical protein
MEFSASSLYQLQRLCKQLRRALSCCIHSESPVQALLLLWQSRPSGPGVQVTGWQDEFLRAQVREMITSYED